jgi:hypothetical protein
VQGERRALGGHHAEALAGAEQVASGVADLHRQAGPFGVLEEAREIEHLVASPDDGLGGHGKGVVGVVMARYEGERRLDQVDHSAQAAGRLWRVVGPNLRRAAEDHPDPVTIHHGKVRDTVAGEIADLYVLGSLASGQ